MKRIALILCVALTTSQPTIAKEIFNIKGIKPGDSEEDLRKVFDYVTLEYEYITIFCRFGRLETNEISTYTFSTQAGDNFYEFKLVDNGKKKIVYDIEYSLINYDFSLDEFIRKIESKYEFDDDIFTNLKRRYDSAQDNMIRDYTYTKNNDVFHLSYRYLQNKISFSDPRYKNGMPRYYHYINISSDSARIEHSRQWSKLQDPVKKAKLRDAEKKAKSADF